MYWLFAQVIKIAMYLWYIDWICSCIRFVEFPRSAFYQWMQHCTKTPDWDALRDLVPFVQFKNVENTRGGVLLLVKLQALAFVDTFRITGAA